MMEMTQQGQEDDTILPSLLRASTASDTALPSLRASTASASTVSLPHSAVIETADVDINMQDQEVGMSYEVHEVGSNEQPLQEQESVSRQTLLGSTSQSIKKDDQTDSNEILKTHSHSSSDCSKELEQMFRRASLDCTQVITGLARPVQDSDCKSYIAKSA